MRHLRALLAIAVVIAAVILGLHFLHAPKSAAPAAAPVYTPVTEQRLSHGRIENLTVYVPHAAPRGFVLLLSGSGGWTDARADTARHIAAQGAMVAGLDVTQFNAALANDGGQCVFPGGDLENLSRFVQAYFHLSTYLTPILAGDGAGGTLAYATLVQAPKNTFAGAVSVDFCPAYDLTKPLCKGSGIESTPRADGKGVDFLPFSVGGTPLGGTPPGGTPWTVIQNGDHAAGVPAAGAPAACDIASVRSFVSRVPGAQLVTVPAAGVPAAGVPVAAGAPWPPQAAGAIDTLMKQNPAALVAEVPDELKDLPIVTVPAQAGSAAGDTFAIILSGDGGWAGLDKDVAGALSATGIPVIGLDSLRYFWSARTPAGLAADLDRMTRYYSKSLGKQRVLLIGYSQGADVLPFAVNHLSEATRSHVALATLMGMSEHALFEFHMSSWVSDDDSGPPTLPEVDKITGIPVLCIYGNQESDTLCPKLDAHRATVVKLKGGHHFDGDYPGLARIILAAAAPH